MSKKIRKAVPTLMAIIAVVVVLSSCNRGMGCPTNFSLDSLCPSVEVGTNTTILE